MSSAFKNVLMHCSVCVFAEVALVYPLAASRHEGAAFIIAVFKKKAFVYLNAAFTLYNLQPLDGQP